MDRIDRDILRVLEIDGRISMTELGQAAGLSANAVAERVRKLTERRTIRRFTTEIEPAAFGFTLRALIEIKMEATTTAAQIEARARETSGVVRAMVTTGRYDWMLEVVATDLEDLQRIIEAIRAGALTRDTYTRVIATDHHFPITRFAR
jgi:Lrp/AsnC family leucine-responsive transcriptional regulator